MQVVEAFRDAHGREPRLMVAAPGRVNLVGEHTDYSYLPVLPIAIEQRLVIAAGEDGDGITATSLAHPGVFEGGKDTNPAWGGYLAGALEMLGEHASGRGARLTIGGDLPSTGGLSSSSALTLGLLWAFNRIWKLGWDRQHVVDLAIEAERRVGVESGGMDQTVIAFADEGHALRIDFAPAHMTQIPVPPNIGFVIGYSGTVAPKGTTARDGYNRAVVSCRAAAALLACASGRDPAGITHLHQVADAPTAALEELPAEITAVEAATRAGVDVDQLVGLTAGVFDPHHPLFPQAAARHVLAEADRVDQAQACLAAGNGPALGEVFDASHTSLVDYGVSTPGLNQLTAAARTAGAWGARLTGAGFGGWAVAVCDPGLSGTVATAMAAATGGPAFAVHPAAGMSDWET